MMMTITTNRRECKYDTTNPQTTFDTSSTDRFNVDFGFLPRIKFCNRSNRMSIQTPKMRKQISQFSVWCEMKSNEELLKVSPDVTRPHDPPNGGKNSISSELKIDNYGKKLK